ncbi:MAG: 2-C-methyl-D-erythritol 4-phosphate cytidylyltransferase [Candidatus Algichlamydia australiensis]|nr:2-C-methyl-D-erythritol 4-phosphate cytidylyltransferase [Chlamydiales bacterium]
MKKIAAIILMGGAGKRFGSSIPKQFQRLSGKPLYLHTLEKFLSINLFSEIILVCHPNWIEKVIAPEGVRVVSGGKTRQESSFLGVSATKNTIEAVVIHDAVRPLISEEILQENVTALQKYEAVDTCIPSTDTIVHAKGEQIVAIPKRSEYLRGQTPQSFSKKLFLEAHKKAQRVGMVNASDDCQLILRLGKAVHVVEGAEENIKITTPLDLYVGEQLMRQAIPSTSSKESLSGKRFVIAGGSGGIGKEICKKLERLGAIVIPLARSTTPFSADLRRFEECRKVFTQIGEIDGLVHAVGNLLVKPFVEFDETEIEELLKVNFKSILYCARFAQIKSGGDFLTIASSSYYRGRKGYGIYSAAKAAAVNFTQSFAEERPDLNVNICLPSRTNTELRRKNFPDENVEELLEPRFVAEEVVKILKRKGSMGTWNLSGTLNNSCTDFSAEKC